MMMTSHYRDTTMFHCALCFRICFAKVVHNYYHEMAVAVQELVVINAKWNVICEAHLLQLIGAHFSTMVQDHDKYRA